MAGVDGAGFAGGSQLPVHIPTGVETGEQVQGSHQPCISCANILSFSNLILAAAFETNHNYI